MKKLGLICIGSELLEGKTHDRNSYLLAQAAFKAGIYFARVVTVHDDPQEIKAALKNLSDCDIVITSGGLGPTADDITKATIADYYQKKLVESQAAKDLSTQLYREKGKDYSQSKANYHIIPEGFDLIYNKVGFAVGLTYPEKHLYLLPGVTAEFECMIREEILPHYTEKNREKLVIKTMGVYEERIFFHLDPELWPKLSALGKLASLPHYTGVDIDLVPNEPMAENIRKAKEIVLNSPLKDYVWSWEETNIVKYMHERLREKKLTLSTAESCTGGLIADLLTNHSGASDYLIGSVVCYHPDVKVKELGVSAEAIKAHTVVSEAVAEQMVKGVMKKFQTNCALATTGYAGACDDPKTPAGTVVIAAAFHDNILVERYTIRGDRVKRKKVFAELALHLLRKLLLN